jgi:hypothetical protein
MKTPKINGFEVIVRDDYLSWFKLQQSAWRKDGVYISTRAEFGASPIRDHKALNSYCKTLDSYGLSYSVHPIMRCCHAS